MAAYVVPAISHAASWLLLLSGALRGIGIGLAQAALALPRHLTARTKNSEPS